jgi:hypothetical protein
LTGVLGARVLNENLPHQVRGSTKEMRAIVPGNLRLIYQAQKRFVDQRRGLQGVTGLFTAQIAFRLLAQLVIHDRQQFIERGTVAVAPIHQHAGDIFCGRSRHNNFRMNRRLFVAP